MSDELNLTPELTLTPDTAAAAQAPQAPNLTLEPTLTAEDAAAMLEQTVDQLNDRSLSAAALPGQEDQFSRLHGEGTVP